MPDDPDPVIAIAIEPIAYDRAWLIRPAGVLSLRNRHRLRAAVLKCLADCPKAVVLDLAELELTDDLAAVVFVGLNREAAGGSGARLLLCRPRERLSERLKALNPKRPIYATLADATDAIKHDPALPNWTYRRLPPEPASLSIAGLMVSDACVAWQLPRLVHPMRAAMFQLMDDAYRCPVKELHVVVSQRDNMLLASVRSPIIDHSDGCLDRPGRGHPADPPGIAHPAVYGHTVTNTDHIGWATLPVTLGSPP